MSDLQADAPAVKATLDELFRRALVRHPDRVALADPADRADFTDGPVRRLTYAEADRAIAALAARLRAFGLPTDAVVAREFKAGAAHRTAAVRDVAADEMILDVGPATIEAFAKRLHNTRTLVWNGPFGAFETPPFDAGTNAAAKLVAAATKAGQLLSVAGGGDTVAALNHAGVADAFSYVSTAGGAFLEWLEGQELPGVAALAGKGK